MKVDGAAGAIRISGAWADEAYGLESSAARAVRSAAGDAAWRVAVDRAEEPTRRATLCDPVASLSPIRQTILPRWGYS